MTIGDERFPRVLARAQAGDHGAIEELYRDLAPLVLGYLRANGAIDAEDLTSEVFVAVVRNVASFDGQERAFRSWVLTIAHRRLVDGLRRRGRRPEDPVEPDDTALVTLADDSTTEELAVAGLGAAAVAAMLAELTDDQRAVVTLRIIDDLPIKEVAEVLGKPVTAVKSLQHRALATLARHLAATGSIPDTTWSDH